MPETETSGSESRAGQPVQTTFRTIGLILVPVAILLSFLDLALAIIAILHHAQAVASPTSTYGTTTARKLAAIAVLSVFGLVNFVATALLYFDWTGTGLSRRARLSLIGWLVTPLAAIALIVIEIFPNQL